MKIIVANWKNFPSSVEESVRMFEVYKKMAVRKLAHLIIAPPLLHLDRLTSMYKGKLINFCGQKVDTLVAESTTGSIHPRLLKDMGVSFCLVGHSEQRHLGLSNDDIKHRFYNIKDANMIPILILGEEKRDKSAQYLKEIRKQLRVVLEDYPKNKPLNFMIAYEPVWAVGAKTAPKQNEISMMSIFIKKELTRIFGEKKAKKVPILYGCSVNEHNISTIMETGVIDGILLGRASFDVKSITSIYESI